MNGPMNSLRLTAAAVFFAAAPALLMAAAPATQNTAISGAGLSPWTARDIAGVTGKPFVATRTIQTRAATSSAIQEVSAKIVRDSSGRVRLETPIPLQPDGAIDPSRVSVQIYDPATRTILSWTTLQKTATLMHLPPAPATADNSSLTRESESLGSHAVNSLTAQGERVSLVIPAGVAGSKDAATVVTETWTASSLKVPMLQTINDPRRGTTTVELSDVSESEPEASLFQAPQGYTVQELNPIGSK